MEQISWLTMLDYQQELHQLSRRVLPLVQNRILTASELELLSRMYLQKEACSPLELSRQTGMKKEAVSRCLKQLSEKGFVKRERRPEDERSYALCLTDSGNEALRQSYGPILQPMYELKRKMGSEFDTMFRLIRQANDRMKEKNGG